MLYTGTHAARFEKGLAFFFYANFLLQRAHTHIRVKIYFSNVFIETISYNTMCNIVSIPVQPSRAKFPFDPRVRRRSGE